MGCQINGYFCGQLILYTLQINYITAAPTPLQTTSPLIKAITGQTNYNVSSASIDQEALQTTSRSIDQEALQTTSDLQHKLHFARNAYGLNNISSSEDNKTPDDDHVTNITTITVNKDNKTPCDDLNTNEKTTIENKSDTLDDSITNATNESTISAINFSDNKDNNNLKESNTSHVNIANRVNMSQKTHITNFIYKDDIRSKGTNQLSNVIPRGPMIRDITEDQLKLETPTSSKIQSTKKERATFSQTDSSNMKEITTMTIMSKSDSKVNQKQEETLHDQDTHFTTETTTADNLLHWINNSDRSFAASHVRSLPDNNDRNNTPNESKDFLNDIFIKISLAGNGDSMMVNWVYASNNTHTSGFLVSYKMNNREDYDSSSLDIAVRSFTLHNLHEDENYVICVHVIVNNTAVKSSCAEWSKSSLKIVVGILAGTIFLVPCLIVIAWILIKDHKMKKKMNLDKINADVANLISHKKSSYTHCHGLNDNEQKNIHDKLDKKSMHQRTVDVAYSNRSLNTPLKDAGHENPCDPADEHRPAEDHGKY